jgi:hypothetical protein
MLNRLRSISTNFLLGDRRWGRWRALAILSLLLLLTIYGHASFPDVTVSHLVQTWLDRSRIWKLVPRPVMRLMALIFLDYRFLWLALAGLGSALFVGASYLREIFDLPQLRYPLRYLVAGIAGWRYPGVVIDNGRLQVDRNTPNLVRDIGGPGRVVVQPGNLVVLENMRKPTRIQAEGSHFLSRFETLKRFPSDLEASGMEVPTIEDQHGYVERARAVTKDGIAIQVEDIHYRYRLRLGRAYGDFATRDPQNPNPFSIEAVRDMAYNRTVRLRDATTGETELTPWHAMINIAVEGAITDYIREHRFNEIVVPAFPETPRREILDRLFTQAIRNRLRGNGAELLWCDIGHFQVTNPEVADQLVENWSAVWEGEAQVRRAFGEARRIEFLERGRAEAQAEMLTQILTAFDAMALRGETRENITNLLLARTAQIIDGLRDRNNPSNPPQIPPPV